MQWNTLDVPLRPGWRCTLYFAHQYCELMRSSSADKPYTRSRDAWWPFTHLHNSWSSRSTDYTRDEEKESRRLLEVDKRDFDRYFRPDWDLRSITGAADLRKVRSFLRELLYVAHRNLPNDNEGIERALRDAVASGRLVPVVNRDWRGLDRVSRPSPAPERWPASSGGGFRSALADGGTKWAAFANAGPGPLMYDGEPVLRGPYDPSTWEAQLKAARAALRVSRDDGDDGDLAGVAGVAAGTMLGSDFDPEDGGDTHGLAESTADGFAESVTGDSLPLGDAEPFEYQPDSPGGDSFDIAKTPNDGEPGTWYTNPGSGQMRLFGDDGKPVVDLDFDHFHHGLKPHAHNWNGGARDGGDDVVPFSPWNP
jgi:hypothetical protein